MAVDEHVIIRLIIIALFADDHPSRNPIPMIVIIINYNHIKKYYSRAWYIGIGSVFS